MSAATPLEVILRPFEKPDETRVMQKGKFELVNVSLHFMGAEHYAT